MGAPVTESNKTILSLHAHPDDAEVFCAGTLSLLRQAGYRVVIGTLTGGGMGGMGEGEETTVAERMREARSAARIIGAEYECLSGRDGLVIDTPELRIEALELIRRKRPEIVLTHLPCDYHSDHRATSQVVEIACMLSTVPNAPTEVAPTAKTPFLYHTAPLRMADHLGRPVSEPDFYLDISAEIDVKMEMLSCHRTQQELMRVMHGMEDFFGEAKQFAGDRGREVGVSYAEAFWQHKGGGFDTEGRLQQVLSRSVRRREQ
jgi:LmbE family N-acetylglucosaminyl deacetylase